MPRENRKRGKKHRKTKEDEPAPPPQPVHQPEPEPEAGPSWIVAGPRADQNNDEAPFGYVDSEVKAYFRTVDVQLREWQEEGHAAASADGDADPNEDRRMFFVAALTEMSGKEKELATDPDCSTILERMAYSMDDFARRVFMDRLTGSYEKLIKHRFASHVCQTFLEVAVDTIGRECRGILPPPPEEAEGELPLMKDMVIDLCEELLPNFSSLIMDPFASHPLRALLALLRPKLFPADQRASTLRSKKSAAYKARQGPMKSVFTDGPAKAGEEIMDVPDEMKDLAVKFVRAVREQLGGNEIRALAASQVASPVLQMLLEIEAEQNMAYERESLADHVLDGLISKQLEDESASHEPSDYVGTLLRDPTSSHLLETLVRRLPQQAFDVVWTTYFEGKLARLAAHPVANFVVARALERASEEQLAKACEELQPVAEKIFKSARTGVLRAMIDQAAALKAHEQKVIGLLTEAISVDLDTLGGRKAFLPCVLRLLTLLDWDRALKAKEANHDAEQQNQQHQGGKGRNHQRKESAEDPMTPKTQGALLLQSMLQLEAPHNQVILDSLFAQSIEDVIAMAHDVTASRVLDVVLSSPTVPFKEKRKLVMNFIGHYEALVDDRIGSRVGDNCWAFADTYLKEKIARSLVRCERDLAASFYGKFFARRLNIYLLQRDPEQWKNLQVNNRSTSNAPTPAMTPARVASLMPGAPPAKATPEPEAARPSKKRKGRPEDEIDALFEQKLGKKVKKAGLAPDAPPAPAAAAPQDGTKDGKERKRKKGDEGEKDKDLTDILGAIKAAPKGEDKSRKHKKKKAA
ncbi:nucleolar protein 9 [Phanerochaete sordida]|uniref:Nucleolar protein 9 n=1 Tax=Phanerochaete sordida TaxID=48140 RepID=A0A9P3FX65_9APHY|nr:nucleolar protein 9 [Phanerochaete sordida]